MAKPGPRCFLFHQIDCIIKILWYWFVSILVKLTPSCFWREKPIKGKTVLITGSGRGLGKALALEFARRGANLVLWSRSAPPLAETKAEIVALGVRVETYVVDVGDKDQVRLAAERVKREVGQVDVLINNAGICWPHCTSTMPNDELDLFIRTNFLAQHYVNHEFVPEMIERDEGHVVAMSSVSGIISIPFQAAYASSKHAMSSYMASLHAELQLLESNVKVTVLSAYIVETEMTKGFNASTTPCLLPNLKLNYTIQRFVHGILTNETEVILGRFWYWISWFLASAPFMSAYHFMRFVGLDRVLRGLVQNRIPEKRANRNLLIGKP
ncbi:unnamed protein product [Bursaphelenchus xylophilus]|uniref:(pine wood nematode) hypothetical protein n=1 Tax=Bursaphelenchus xylophilus TaxID=6326 RepID=A0A1I7SF33_BURXY|nr:unnamed protein product [Bursaphelenchus xylophilus]CAG9078908.1 unnamed protein product [Bursaphelenchus xylophilus]